MIEHIFSILCDSTSIDKYSNSLSIFKVIERIVIYSEPEKTIQLPMHFEIISQWMRSDVNNPCTGYARVSLHDPKGISKKNVEIEIDLSKSLFGNTLISSIWY